MLKDRLRDILLAQVQTGDAITYKELADRLELAPPQTIHRVTQALEALMIEDVAAGRPLISALCVSRRNQTVPARGFFTMATMLGMFSGDPESPMAYEFYVREFNRALAFYRL